MQSGWRAGEINCGLCFSTCKTLPIAGCNFSVPVNLDDPAVKDDLITFQNNNDEEFEASMKKCLAILEETMEE